jgi:hypothetical protein
VANVTDLETPVTSVAFLRSSFPRRPKRSVDQFQVRGNRRNLAQRNRITPKSSDALKYPAEKNEEFPVLFSVGSEFASEASQNWTDPKAGVRYTQDQL